MQGHFTWAYMWFGGSLSLCPSNSTASGSTCTCNEGYVPNGAATACVPLNWFSLNQTGAPPSCGKSPGKGDPIYPLRGVERMQQDTGVAAGALRIELTYDSAALLPRTYINNVPAGVPTPGTSIQSSGTGIVGTTWKSSFQRGVVLPSVSNSSTPAPVIPTTVERGARSIVFTSTNGAAPVPLASSADRLVGIAGGGYRYYDGQANTQETYDSNGRITAIDWVDGQHVGYTYSDASTPAAVAPGAGLVIGLSDQYGRSVALTYTQAAGHTGTNWALLSTLTDAAGRTVTLEYDSNYALTSITWPDGRQRGLVYGTGAQALALKGVLDELGAQYATIGYDTNGVAIFSELAGGVERYSTSYASAPGIRVTDNYDSASGTIYRTSEWVQPQGVSVTQPTGAVSNWASTSLLSNSYLTSQSQPAGSGCAASSSALSYDTNGNVASADDFNGSRSCSAYDLSRNLETTRVEGLANTQACSGVTGAGSTLPTGSRKTSTSWHPDWKLETKRAEPGKLTTSIYNGQPDPFNGNAIASCAPSTAVLPDGKPIAVLCKQVEQATNDANGSQGFSASLQSGVANRVQQWTYNQYGQVLTAKDALNHTTTYAYYSDTAFTGSDPNAVGHTLGDLQSVTNAKGQVTSYTKYNKHGQLLESTDPNGVVTVNTYDLRQRLLSTSVGSQTTSYEYDPAGQLLKVTNPDASWIGYEYDAAHRQNAVKDNLGNRIEYVLDNAGNKTGQSVKDPGGNLARALSRSIDALGRVQQQTGRE